MVVRRLFVVSLAQLNSCSAAALAGSAVFSRRNRAFNAGQAAMLSVSDDSDRVCRYCCSLSDGVVECSAGAPTREEVVITSLRTSSCSCKSYNDN